MTCWEEATNFRGLLFSLRRFRTCFDSLFVVVRIWAVGIDEFFNKYIDPAPRPCSNYSFFFSFLHTSSRSRIYRNKSLGRHWYVLCAQSIEEYTKWNGIDWNKNEKKKKQKTRRHGQIERIQPTPNKMVETYKSPTLVTNVKQKYAVLCESPFRDHFIIHLFMCLITIQLIFCWAHTWCATNHTNERPFKNRNINGPRRLLFSFWVKLTIYNFNIAGHFVSEAEASRRPYCTCEFSVLHCDGIILLLARSLLVHIALESNTRGAVTKTKQNSIEYIRMPAARWQCLRKWNANVVGWDAVGTHARVLIYAIFACSRPCARSQR